MGRSLECTILMLDKLTLQDFTPMLGASFQVAGKEGLSLSLLQAKALVVRSGTPSAAREPFDLIFVGPGNPVLPQSIYRLEREGAEPLEIFIVPIGPTEGGMGYQAIFT